MPAGEIGAADLTDFARAHEIVQRAQRLFHWRQRVEAMQLVEIDVVSAESPQAVLNRLGQMLAPEPTSSGPSPILNVPLVEMRT